MLFLVKAVSQGMSFYNKYEFRNDFNEKLINDTFFDKSKYDIFDALKLTDFVSCEQFKHFNDEVSTFEFFARPRKILKIFFQNLIFA